MNNPAACLRLLAGSRLAPALVAVSLAACSASPQATAPSPGAGAARTSVGEPARLVTAADLTPADRDWIERTLAALDLEEKAAQMVMVSSFGRYEHPESTGRRTLHGAVDGRERGGLGVGGVIVFDADLESIPTLLDSLQQRAPVPLLVASDLERGLSFRVRRGATSLPYAMAIGATRSPEAARFAGAVTAREGRAAGIHWTFAPVADVNNDPANPVINIRSFGEEPGTVAELTAAFVEGVQAGGMLATAKHFPGHGDTGTDSHVDLPVLGVGRDRLAAVELPPFRAAIEAGVESVMIGHIALPEIDPSGAPATLSPALSGDLLRDELGFGGLIVTDAMDMAGVRSAAWAGAAAVRTVAAGSDVILMPRDPGVVVESLVRAVAEGQLTQARIDRSVRRILETKARLGLHRDRRAGRRSLGEAVARPEDVRRADEIAERSITLVKNEGGVLPLAAETRPRILHLVLASGRPSPTESWLLRRELPARGVAVDTRFLWTGAGTEIAAELVAAAAENTHVVVSARVDRPPAGEAALDDGWRELIGRLGESGRPVIVVAYGTPYLLTEIPEVPVYLATYGSPAASLRAAAKALFGEIELSGRLPVTLPGLYPVGHGMKLARRPMTLEQPSPEFVCFRPGGLAEIDRLIESFITPQTEAGDGAAEEAEQAAFPGAVLAVGHRGRLVHLQAYGRLSYDEDAPPVTVDTIYDLASLTKVVATTTMAMMLLDDGRIGLDMALVDFLPRFVGPSKEKVTLRHLLTHTSGVDWWAPLYEEVAGRPAYLDRIQALPLVAEPGTRMRYSDLGILLLGEALERAAGRPLDAFAEERIFAPLGMADTGFRPDESLRDRIAPTEDDPWRGRVVHGEVHDENAAALGGIAAHAGLFGTAPDLARFAQMLLNGGVLEHRRIVSPWVVDLFTRRADLAPPGAGEEAEPVSDSRALGWDTKSPEGSSAGTLFSPSSFGHTGFTGTSIWIDPERELFVILLTNRVHPTRDNHRIREVRPAVADAVVRALLEP